MSVGEFTVSNIHMDEDKREEEIKKKNSQLDMDKFKKDLATTLQLADQVRERAVPVACVAGCCSWPSNCTSAGRVSNQNNLQTARAGSDNTHRVS